MSDIEEVNDFLLDYDPEEHRRHIEWHLRMESIMNTTEPTDFHALRRLATEGLDSGHLDRLAHERAQDEISRAESYVLSLQKQLAEAEASATELKSLDTDKVEPELGVERRNEWQEREDRITAMHLAEGDVDRARKIVAFIKEG